MRSTFVCKKVLDLDLSGILVRYDQGSDTKLSHPGFAEAWLIWCDFLIP
ncbi:hypothetical protein HanPSC8_Chr14g0599731 [Helianthus annuus]|nr:hypothetical protein HanPSC8_Chr14g0599731 [Helianthus annuus]